jgi:hypothetical protein
MFQVGSNPHRASNRLKVRDARRGAARQSLTERQSAFSGFFQWIEIDSLFVVAGLVPAIHAFLAGAALRRGCPGQARAWRALW